MPKVSVIVPAFNAEMYLEYCLKSISSQTMHDFECIIVNDGSTDKTGQIADSFAKYDTRFHVIHQENVGVALARQAGIEAATGDYTIQFDADDWVEENILDELLFVAEERDADMVICDISMSTSTGEFIWHQNLKCLDSNVVLGQMMQQLCCSLWNKLIKRECYHNYNIKFVPGELSEDLYVCLCLLSHPLKIDYVPKALYHYDTTKNLNALTKTMIIPLARLKSYELYAVYSDVSNVQNDYDNAILKTAYEALFIPKNNNWNYSRLFKKHLPSICRATKYPFRVKLIVILRIYGISIPIAILKRVWKELNRYLSYKRN